MMDMNSNSNNSGTKSKNTKLIIIIIAVAIFLSCSCCCCGTALLFSSDDKRGVEDSESSSVSASESSEFDESSTVDDTEETTTLISTSLEVPKCTDMELLTIDGHPTFYGSSEKAHEVWDRYSAEDTVMIKGFVGHSNTYDEAILVLDCFKGSGAYQKTDSDIVNGVHISFSNFSDGKKVRFQEALSIASDYFPYEIMSEKYSLFESCYQNIGTEEKPYYKYFINYKLNDVTQSVEYHKDCPYYIWVSVVFNVDSENNVDLISISPYRTSDARHEPEKFEWGYDFLSN